MRRLLRMNGFGLGGLLVLIAIISVSVYAASSARLNRTYTFTNLPLAIPSDAASSARGQHLVVAIAKCADCHTADLSRRLVLL